jgi:hypothetical protein
VDAAYLVVDIRRDVAVKESQMKTIFAVLALCAFAQSALAAGPDCRAIESTNGRLACYDAASSPEGTILGPSSDICSEMTGFRP